MISLDVKKGSYLTLIIVLVVFVLVSVIIILVYRKKKKSSKDSETCETTNEDIEAKLEFYSNQETQRKTFSRLHRRLSCGGGNLVNLRQSENIKKEVG